MNQIFLFKLLRWLTRTSLVCGVLFQNQLNIAIDGNYVAIVAAYAGLEGYKKFSYVKMKEMDNQ